jgi:hypothetical protein
VTVAKILPVNALYIHVCIYMYVCTTYIYVQHILREKETCMPFYVLGRDFILYAETEKMQK